MKHYMNILIGGLKKILIDNIHETLMKEGSFIISNYTAYRNKIIYLLTNSEIFDKSIELNSVTGIVDMSINYCVVERKCPRLLTDFTQFIKEPDEYGEVNSKFCPGAVQRWMASKYD